MKKQTASLLLADDEPDFRVPLATLLENAGFAVAQAVDGVEAINRLQQGRYDTVILDLQMPRVNGLEVLGYVRDRGIDTPVVVLTAVHDIHVAVETIKLGAFDFVSKPVQFPELINVIERALERTRLLQENAAMRRSLEQLQAGQEIIGRSPAFLECLDLAARVAPSDGAVLIQGPSGSGKELIANLIHRQSPRTTRPFLALNCAALPEHLLESELFGHEKGAFTDASASKEGLVEVADGGTLFLDEVGELALPIQPKLLRFLQTGEYRRVGGNQSRHADVRIVSATNRDLRTDVAGGRFREDLFYRLNVVTINVPPLKERRDDIALLAEYFLRKTRVSHQSPRAFHPDAIKAMLSYHWPGNIRELQNAVERAAIIGRQAEIRPEDLVLGATAPVVHTNTSDYLGSALTLVQAEGAHIKAVLESVGRNKKLAAKILGVSLKTLYTKLQKHQIR
jgi:DNA-binding NtrC family response regulator